MGIVDRMRDEGATFPFLDAHGTHHLRSIGRPQTTSMSNRPRGRETMMPMIRRGGFSRRPQYNRTEGRDDEREEEYDRIIWRPRHVNYWSTSRALLNAPQRILGMEDFGRERPLSYDYSYLGTIPCIVSYDMLYGTLQVPYFIYLMS